MTSGEYFENKWFDMNEPVIVYWFYSMKSDSGTLSHFVFIATVCNVYSLNRQLYKTNTVLMSKSLQLQKNVFLINKMKNKKYNAVGTIPK